MKTHEILKMTPEQYAMLVFDAWFHWCNLKGFGDKQVQMFLACAALFKWWRANLDALETEFREDAAPYREFMSASDALKLYTKHINKLNFYYSSPLINKALNSNIIK